MLDGLVNAVSVICTIGIALIPSLGGLSVLGICAYLCLVGD